MNFNVLWWIPCALLGACIGLNTHIFLTHDVILATLAGIFASAIYWRISWSRWVG